MRWQGSGRSIAVGATILAGGLAWAGPAHAAGGPRYVTVHRHGAEIVLRPTHRLVRHDAGRRITVTCSSVARQRPDGTSIQSGSGESARVRRGLTLPVDRSASDYCFVRLGARHGKVPPEQEIALTRRGSSHLQLRDATVLLVGYSTVAYMLDPPNLPPTQTLADDLHLVALASPDAPTAPGTTGVWTDGAGRVVVATTLRDGRRAFIDYDRATNVTRTNVLDVILELQDPD